MSRKSAEQLDRARLDALIDFYECHKPGAGQRIAVALPPAALAKLVGAKAAAREIPYRGRLLVSTGAEGDTA
jgi:hypothetical protein